MIYYKRPDETVTSLSMFVDKNIKDVYEVGKNPALETEIFRAIYLIIYMLACKQSIFKQWDKLDDFAIFAAKMVYMRMINPKQWTTEPGVKKLDPIKSVLNYINNSMNGMKIHYQNEAFHQILDPEVDPRINSCAITAVLKSQIQQDYNFGKDEAICDTFTRIPKAVKKVVYQSPYRKNKKTIKNLYLSVLLTLLNNVTLPRTVLNKIDKSKNTLSMNAIAYKSLQKNSENDVILWRLDKSFGKYVDLLTRKAKLEFSKEISSASTAFDLNDNILDAIMSSAYDNSYNSNEEE